MILRMTVIDSCRTYIDLFVSAQFGMIWYVTSAAFWILAIGMGSLENENETTRVSHCMILLRRTSWRQWNNYSVWVWWCEKHRVWQDSRVSIIIILHIRRSLSMSFLKVPCNGHTTFLTVFRWTFFIQPVTNWSLEFWSQILVNIFFRKINGRISITKRVSAQLMP